MKLKKKWIEMLCTLNKLSKVEEINEVPTLFKRIKSEIKSTDSNKCLLCKRSFNYLFTKQNCKFCGLIVCSKCIKEEVIPTALKQKEKICSMCRKSVLQK